MNSTSNVHSTLFSTAFSAIINYRRIHEKDSRDIVSAVCRGIVYSVTNSRTLYVNSPVLLTTGELVGGYRLSCLCAEE